MNLLLILIHHDLPIELDNEDTNKFDVFLRANKVEIIYPMSLSRHDDYFSPFSGGPTQSEKKTE